MGLKNLTSIFDLVAGNNPVESMGGQTGPTSQLPTDVASQVHIDSLQVVPGPPSNSPFQDLGGLPDPNFNTLNGTSDSPFQGQTGDHMIDLLTQHVLSTNTNQVYNPAPNTSQYQDLNGLEGPDFDNGPNSTLQPDSLLNTYNYQYGNSPETTGPVPGGDSNSPYQDLNGLEGPSFDNGPNSTLQQDSLLNAYNYQYGNSAEIAGPVPGGDSNSPYQDLNGLPGPNFDNGTNSTLQDDSLVNAYQSSVNPGASYGAGQPGGAWPSVNSANLDLDGNPGPSFNNGPNSTLQDDALVNAYQSPVNPGASYGAGQPNGTWPTVNSADLDLDGNPGPSFDGGPNSTIQPDSLINIYQSGINQGASYGAGQPNGTWPSVNPSTFDLDGNPGPSFNGGISSTLKVDLLANVYQSGINPGASYGAGQPGGVWPSVNPSPLASTPFADLDGITPSQYLNNLPN